MLGITNSTLSFTSKDLGQIGCVYETNLSDCDYVIEKFANVLTFTDDEFQAQFIDNKRTELSDLNLFFHVDENGAIDYMASDPWYPAQLMISTGFYDRIDVTPVDAADKFLQGLSMLVLIVGIGLIVASTWQYIGKEARSELYT
eukprot:UN29358